MSNQTSHGQSNTASRVDLSVLADKIFRQLQSDLGEAWTNRLSQSDRDLVQAVSNDAAAVVVLGLAGTAEQAARDKAQVDAQLLNLTSAEAGRVNQQFWASVGAAVKAALGVAIALA